MVQAQWIRVAVTMQGYGSRVTKCSPTAAIISSFLESWLLFGEDYFNLAVEASPLSRCWDTMSKCSIREVFETSHARMTLLRALILLPAGGPNVGEG